MEKKKLLKNKIVDTLPMLYFETVILIGFRTISGKFYSWNSGRDCHCGASTAAEIRIFEYGVDVCDLFGNLGSGTVLDSDQKEKPSDPAGSWNKTAGK